MGSRSTTSAPTSTTMQADNRVAIGNDGASVGSFGSYYRDQSTASAWNSGNTSSIDTRVSDNSVRTFDDHSLQDFSQYFSDSSNRSTNVSDSSSRTWSSADNSNRSVNVSDTSSRDNSTKLTDSSSRTWSSSTADNSNRSISVSDTSSRDSSTHLADSSSRSYLYDSSNRSVTNITTTDPGLVEAAKFTSALQQAISENQGDAVKSIARFGSDAITRQSQAATDLFATGSAEAGKAWGHTIDASSELIDKLLTTAQGTITGAQSVARDAISSYQPSDSATAGNYRAAIIGAVAIVGAALISRRA